MSEGENKTVEIPASEAYGDINQDLLAEVPKEQLPENVKIGETLQGNGPQGPIMVTVREIRENTVIVDANHPLAGKKLIFDLDLVSIS
jgi:FKBP-type peptidyl-prolyl cis-trans isomerase 2